MTNILLFEKSTNIVILTLNNPAKLNPLSEEMLYQLTKKFEEIGNDKNIKAVILKSTGKAFCAGHDLKQMQLNRDGKDGGKEYFQLLFNKCGYLMQTIRQLPQPVIASVNGLATAAGCQLVATCDLAIASENARFGVNGVNIGLFCSTPMVALTRNIGKKKTFEMLVTGDFIDAETAKIQGLINKVVSEPNLSLETMALATKISSKLGSAVKIGKEAFYKQSEMNIQDAYAYTANVMAENMLNADTNEGINAFVEKRSPEWKRD